MATHMRAPSVQLGHSPRAPTRVPTVPPPSIWNVVSSGAIVWPCAYRKMRPRHMRSPPRVTMNDGTPPYATTKPCSPPTTAPSAIPSTSVTTQVYGCSSPSPRLCGIQTAWNIAIVYPRKPSMDPTERSMFRDTMTRTIPVAMIAIEALCTERFQRFRAERNVPPDTMLKLIQMMTRAATIPSMRGSTSRVRSTPVTGASAERTVATSERTEPGGSPSTPASLRTETPISLLTRPPSCASVKTRPAPARARAGRSSHELRRHQPQAEALPAGTPWHRSALVIQPASRTRLRLSLVMGFGCRRIELSVLPPGVLNAAVPLTLLGSELLQSCIAASPALLPSMRASFHTPTGCVPSATRLRAALSPS